MCSTRKIAAPSSGENCANVNARKINLVSGKRKSGVPPHQYSSELGVCFDFPRGFRQPIVRTVEATENYTLLTAGGIRILRKMF